MDGKILAYRNTIQNLPALANSLNADLPLAQVLQTGGAATSITPMAKEPQ